jgi:hypothetical protein
VVPLDDGEDLDGVTSQRIAECVGFVPEIGAKLASARAGIDEPYSKPMTKALTSKESMKFGTGWDQEFERKKHHPWRLCSGAVRQSNRKRNTGRESARRNSPRKAALNARRCAQHVREPALAEKCCLGDCRHGRLLEPRIASRSLAPPSRTVSRMRPLLTLR